MMWLPMLVSLAAANEPGLLLLVLPVLGLALIVGLVVLARRRSHRKRGQHPV